MKHVVALVKVFPEGVDTDLEKLLEDIKKSLPNEYSIAGHSTEPLAFGLKVLVLSIMLPENTVGGTSDLENILSKVNGVSQIEILRVSRAIE